MLETAADSASDMALTSSSTAHQPIPEAIPTIAVAEVGESLKRAASASRLEDLDMSVANALMQSTDAFDLVAQIASISFPIAVEINLRAEWR